MRIYSKEDTPEERFSVVQVASTVVEQVVQCTMSGRIALPDCHPGRPLLNRDVCASLSDDEHINNRYVLYQCDSAINK